MRSLLKGHKHKFVNYCYNNKSRVNIILEFVATITQKDIILKFIIIWISQVNANIILKIFRT